MAIHLFNDAVPRKWRLINLVLFLISLLLASPICRVTKGWKGERGRGKTDYTFMLHILPFPSHALTFSASFLTFGKCQRKNCAQNEAQFTALVVCKLSHLQSAPRSFPIPPSSSPDSHPSAAHFHYDCLFSFFIIPCCQRHFQVTSTNLYRLSSLPSLLLPLPLLAPRQSTEACPCPYFGSYSPKLLPFGNLHSEFHAFLQIYTFVGVLFYWVSSLVSIRFLARGGGLEGEGGYPLNGV